MMGLGIIVGQVYSMPETTWDPPRQGWPYPFFCVELVGVHDGDYGTAAGARTRPRGQRKGLARHVSSGGGNTNDN